MKNIWNIFEKVVRFLTNTFLKIVHKELTELQWETFLQFIKFGIIGVSNTVISYVLNVMVLLVMRPYDIAWDYIAGNVVSFLLSVLWSFYWNNKYVFTLEEGEHRTIGKTLLKTYIAYGFTGIILNSVLSWMWISCFNVSKFIVPAINLFASVPINFIMNKLWAFKGKEEK